MPLIKRGIEPVNLSRGDVAPGVKNELECVTNNTLANVIRQLSSLSKYAEDMFGELFRDANAIFSRGQRLQARVDRLKVKVTQLDSTVEEVSLQDINMRKPFKSSVIKDQQCITLFSRPQAISETYQQCDSPPALSKLNAYREDGKDSMKFYTDPTYFFELWSQDMQRDTEAQKKELRRKHRRKPKRISDSVKVRQVKSRQHDYQRLAMGKEFVPDDRRNQQQQQQQQQQQHYENRSPSRPNSLELPANVQIGNDQNYAPGSQNEQDAMYRHANGPVGHPGNLEDHGGHNASYYNAPPPYGQNNVVNTGGGQHDIYNQGQGYREGSPQHTPTKRPMQNITSPRPSQPPPAPPGGPSPMGNRSGNTSRDHLPPPPPPPPGGDMMSNRPYSPMSTPTHMVNNMNLRDSPVRHTPSPQAQLKSSTPDSIDLPPPPPPPLSQTPDTPGNMGVMPPPPPTPPPPEMHDMGGPAGAPPPPAPPPPPLGAIMSNSLNTSKMPNGSVPIGHLMAPNDGMSIKSNNSSTTVSSGSVPSEQPAEEAVDERSDLLCAIREGIKLRKVERQQKDEQRRHTGGHLDVQSIMEAAFEMRRKALEADASDDEEDEEEEGDEWSDEG